MGVARRGGGSRGGCRWLVGEEEECSDDKARGHEAPWGRHGQERAGGGKA